MDTYEQYEADCKLIRKANAKLLSDFEFWLQTSKLKTKTIGKHIENVDFYINEFLLYDEAVEAKDGASSIGLFLGYWFIKKAMWASAANIKSSAASLKKFYTFLFENSHVDGQELINLKAMIKEDMPEWIETVKRYDDPSITDMDDVWGDW